MVKQGTILRYNICSVPTFIDEILTAEVSSQSNASKNSPNSAWSEGQLVFWF